MNFFKFLFAATMATTTPENPFKGSVEYQKGDPEKLTFNFENVPTDAISDTDTIKIAFPAESATELTDFTLASELDDWDTPVTSISNEITIPSTVNAGETGGAWPQQLEFNLPTNLPRYSSKSQFTITLSAGSQTTSIDLPKELKFGGSVEYKEADDQLTFKFSDQAKDAESTDKIDIVFPGEISGTAKLPENSDWTISNSKKTISLKRKNGATDSWPEELIITGAIGETRFSSESHITITFEDDAKYSGTLETLTIDVPETLAKETPSGSKGSSLSVLSLALLLVA